MNYKFKVGDRVRVKPDADMVKIGIREPYGKELKETAYIITEASPGRWPRSELKDINNTPTYDVNGWRIPESYLVKEKKTSVHTG